MIIDTNSYSNIKEEYLQALKWIQSLGVNFSSGRTGHYEKVIDRWSTVYKTASEQEAKDIFPDFVSSMFEITDFIDVYKALHSVSEAELDQIAKKLQKGINGPINSAEESDKSSAARNFIFEALVAARLHRPNNGVKTIFNSTSDTGIKIDKHNIYIECKRLKSLDKLETNVRKACNQLESSIKRDVSSQARGIVALDFSKILHTGDKLLVKGNDSELIRELDAITDKIMNQCSNNWQKVYGQKNKNIMGSLVHFSTMATSEERNLIVTARQWAVNAKLNIRPSDKALLQQLTAAMK
jgi:ribosomal silencing factor RsfS